MHEIIGIRISLARDYSPEVNLNIFIRDEIAVNVLSTTYIIDCDEQADVLVQSVKDGDRLFTKRVGRYRGRGYHIQAQKTFTIPVDEAVWQMPAILYPHERAGLLIPRILAHEYFGTDEKFYKTNEGFGAF